MFSLQRWLLMAGALTSPWQKAMYMQNKQAGLLAARKWDGLGLNLETETHYKCDAPVVDCYFAFYRCEHVYHDEYREFLHYF